MHAWNGYKVTGIYTNFVNKKADAQTHVFVFKFYYFPKLHRGAITLLDFAFSVPAPHTPTLPPGCTCLYVINLRRTTYDFEGV